VKGKLKKAHTIRKNKYGINKKLNKFPSSTFLTFLNGNAFLALTLVVVVVCVGVESYFLQLK
jgi:hypothetical protein